MKKIVLIVSTSLIFQVAFSKSFIFSDSTSVKKENLDNTSKEKELNEIKTRLKILNEKSPIDLVYNKAVENAIKFYLGKNKGSHFWRYQLWLKM